MKIFAFLALLAVFSIPVFGQTSAKSQPPKVESKKETAVRLQFETFLKQFVEAYNKQDADALAGFYAEDATYIGTGGDVTQSKDKIHLGLKGSLRYFRDFTATPAEFGTSGDLAYQRGTYSQRLEVPNQPSETFTGKYLLILRRQKDKSWKIESQMVSRDRSQR